jgi:hypothetical protein
MTLSGSNTGTIGQNLQAITITVVDGSTRCPTDYQQSQQPQWDKSWHFTQGL